MKIGDLAKQTDVAVGTIRYYESLGLIAPVARSEKGYRYYETEAIDRIRFIKKAQSLHFSLAEIQQVVGVRTHGKPVCSLVKGLLKEKIADLDRQIYLMKSLRAELTAYQESWDDRPSDEPNRQEICSMIDEVTYPAPKVHQPGQ